MTPVTRVGVWAQEGPAGFDPALVTHVPILGLFSEMSLSKNSFSLQVGTRCSVVVQSSPRSRSAGPLAAEASNNAWNETANKAEELGHEAWRLEDLGVGWG